jgi:hypothetical protein
MTYCNTTLSATAQIPNHSESNVVKGDAGTTVTSSSEENECNVAITPIVDAVSTGLLTNARSNGTDVPTSPPTTIRSETDNNDSHNISDVTLSIPLDAEGIFDLSLMLDPNGTLLLIRTGKNSFVTDWTVVEVTSSVFSFLLLYNIPV